ncbi:MULTISPECIES: MarR family winged helix-turn-helix transcriptional regulator [unclassified Mesorhizobium]|uniref:MarR family winged helix-turn-helix transcriptional regulator n=1 Tax=unclassified Mesorhizobium TaxID=325217 RepID=UPI000F74E9AC|nr:MULTISPECIES: MarR family winged helix-turn-helix transcriptional regulator [unclassified Mesorhizobium]AZO55574.1 MarR family transcriptional regulator [Mesorhizobium sp. M8A.F.Ca.ET.057.01.1.1]RWE42941.1 MAG: MarR family transcriptional regulator [Mesorhizobium sp.]
MSDRNALVGDIRRFNRFYTGLIGLLDETLMHSAYTLTEARVLFELGHGPRDCPTNPGGKTGFLARALRLDVEPVASAIARDLQVDPAYVSRIIRKFSAAGLTEMCTGPAPLRPRVLSLSARGQASLAALHAATDRDLARLTAGLNDWEAAELSDVLTRARHLLGAAMAPERPEVP